MRQDLTGVRRNWLECRVGLIDAYARTMGLDFGYYYVRGDPAESGKVGSLLRYRLANYRRLCIREFLNISFPDYLASPRHVIAEYDEMCIEWSKDPAAAAAAAAQQVENALKT